MSDSVTPWTVDHQALQSIELSRQEYLSGLPFPTSGGLCNPGIKPVSLLSPALAGGFHTTEPPGKPSGALGHSYWDWQAPSFSCSLGLYVWPPTEDLFSEVQRGAALQNAL